jgi:RNA polymerase sigma factor (sigma-70 family)
VRGVCAAQSGDVSAREELLEQFMPVIRRAARTYAGMSALTSEELEQEGVVGLFLALGRFDPERGVPFSAYASWWVARGMQRLVAELTLPVVMSDRAMRQLARLKHARQDHEQAYHCEPSRGELAESTGYTRQQLDCLLCAELCPCSLEEPLLGDDGGATLADAFADPSAEEGYASVERELDASAFRQSPNDLSERERAVLRRRYGFEGPTQTLEAVGGELDVTPERVRQIQEHALERLRAACSTVLSESVAEHRDAPRATGSDPHRAHATGSDPHGAGLTPTVQV